MKRRTILQVLSVICGVVLLMLVTVPLPSAVPVGAAPAAPQVTVLLKNYLEEYDLATAEFLAAQFGDLDSPAYGLVAYTLVTSLTQQALSGSVALIIDESADMSLTGAESTLIHSFVRQGGRIGLFTFPSHYWDHEGPNPSAFQAIADLFGNATIGQPDEIELESGVTSAAVSLAGCSFGLCFTGPYSLTGALVMNYDKTPFSPIVSAGTASILTSPAFDGAEVAVVNGYGILVTNPIGDMVQGGDSNLAYRQFVADAIVWLADPGAMLPNKLFLPIVMRR
jgi:hypothetical protein